MSTIQVFNSFIIPAFVIPEINKKNRTVTLSGSSLNKSIFLLCTSFLFIRGGTVFFFSSNVLGCRTGVLVNLRVLNISVLGKYFLLLQRKNNLYCTITGSAICAGASLKSCWISPDDTGPQNCGSVDFAMLKCGLGKFSSSFTVFLNINA